MKKTATKRKAAKRVVEDRDRRSRSRSREKKEYSA